MAMVWRLVAVQPCQQEEGIPFIRLTNAGEQVLGFKTQGFLCARIMQVRARQRAPSENERGC